MNKKYFKSQQGFTIMEIVVATTIFVTSVTLMMSLFVYTLRINRRVDALRQSSQGARNFVEFLVREIRNGRIDYTTSYTSCSYNYTNASNTALAIVNRSGEPECFYLSGTNLYMEKAGTTTQINPANMTLTSSNFHFTVYPTTNASPTSAPYPGIQPFVVISLQFNTTVPGVTNPVRIYYQTAVSPDVYDIPHS